MPIALPAPSLRDRREQLPIAPSGNGVEDEVRDPDDRVGAGEEKCVVPERARHGERGDQHRPHRPEHDQPHDPLLGIDRVRQPGIGGPRPPEHAEHEQTPDEARPRRIGDDEPRHLRDRENENQVEEELERSDALLTTVACAGRHRASLSSRCGSPASRPSRSLGRSVERRAVDVACACDWARPTRGNPRGGVDPVAGRDAEDPLAHRGGSCPPGAFTWLGDRSGPRRSAGCRTRRACGPGDRRRRPHPRGAPLFADPRSAARATTRGPRVVRRGCGARPR